MISPAQPVLLVARSAGQLPATLEILAAAGYPHAMGVPVSTTAPAPFSIPANVTALILTSPNTLTNPQLHTLTHLPVYAVGPATADAAKAIGFTVHYTGTADARHMVDQLCRQHIAPQVFFHPRASNAGTEWYEALQAGGHILTGQTAYTTTPVAEWPPALLQQLQHMPPTHALVFSQAGGRNLHNLLARHNLPVPPVTVAISAHTATGLPKEVRVAPSPNLPSMLTCLV